MAKLLFRLPALTCIASFSRQQSAIVLLGAGMAAAGDDAACQRRARSIHRTVASGRLADPGGIRASLATRGASPTAPTLYRRRDFLEHDRRHRARGERSTTAGSELYVDADFEKAYRIGRACLSHQRLPDPRARASPRPRSAISTYLGNIEATATTRLFELWMEQKFHDDMLSVRFGQLGVDPEFIISDTAANFISSAFGWPTPPSRRSCRAAAWPIRSRHRACASSLRRRSSFTIRAGVYNDNPAGPGPGDPQLRDKHGLNFRISDYPYVIGEIEYKYGQDAAQSLLAQGP